MRSNRAKERNRKRWRRAGGDEKRLKGRRRKQSLLLSEAENEWQANERRIIKIKKRNN